MPKGSDNAGRSYRRTHIGAVLLGPPISQPSFARNGVGTGRSYLVQYLENARFEYRPELAGAGYQVRLGREYLHLRDWL